MRRLYHAALLKRDLYLRSNGVMVNAEGKDLDQQVEDILQKIETQGTEEAERYRAHLEKLQKIKNAEEAIKMAERSRKSKMDPSLMYGMFAPKHIREKMSSLPAARRGLQTAIHRIEEAPTGPEIPISSADIEFIEGRGSKKLKKGKGEPKPITDLPPPGLIRPIPRYHPRIAPPPKVSLPSIDFTMPSPPTFNSPLLRPSPPTIGKGMKKNMMCTCK